jgi:hypothetical protein
MPKFVIERELPGAGSLSPQIVRDTEQNGPADSVGAQLCYPGQDLLHLHCTGREDRSRTGKQGRFSREPRFRNQSHD